MAEGDSCGLGHWQICHPRLVKHGQAAVEDGVLQLAACRPKAPHLVEGIPARAEAPTDQPGQEHVHLVWHPKHGGRREEVKKLGAGAEGARGQVH